MIFAIKYFFITIFMCFLENGGFVRFFLSGGRGGGGFPTLFNNSVLAYDNSTPDESHTAKQPTGH